jgi:hypothetical protein
VRPGRKPCINPVIHYFPMHSKERQEELWALLKDFDKWAVADRLKRYSTSSTTLPASTTPGAAIASSSLPSSQTLGPIATSPLPPSSPPPASSLPVALSSPSRIPVKEDIKKTVKIYIYLAVSTLQSITC